MSSGEVTEEAALLKWVNTFPLDPKVESWAELTDGLVLSQMLEDMDPRFGVPDIDSYTSPSKWLAKKKALEAVYRSLLRYIQNHCKNYNPADLGESIDLNAIAEDDDAHQTVQLVTLFLMASINGPSNTKYLTKMQKDLDEASLLQISHVIKKGMTTEGVATEPADAKLPPKLTKDIDLAFEEEHANLKAEFANLEKRHADTYTRLERLQESYDELLANSKETEQELESLKSSYDGDQADYIKSLKSQLQEANALIQNQEQQMEMDRETKESQQKELATLRPSSKRIVDLEDEVRELKIENESLSKKANITNNLQRKLQDQSGLQKDNADLRRRLDVLEENQKEFDRVHQQNVIQDRTIKEFEKKFVSYELQVVEQDRQRRLLDEEVRDRDFKIQKLLTQQQNDENFIRQLQETINLSNTTGGSPPSPSGALTLEQELEQSDESTPNYTLEISRLKAENQLLKSNTAGTNNANLRIDLEEAERNRKRLEETIRDLTEKNTIVQSQLNALISNSTGEKLVKDMDRLLAIGPLHILTDEFYRNEAVISTRKLYIEANNELSALKNKLADLQAQLSARDRELLTAKADLAAIDQEEIDALADLKEANELVTSSLQNDLLLLQDKHKTLTAELEEKKSHLVDALLSKERLTQDLASLKERYGAANHDDQIEKARARSIIEEEEARKKKTALEALQEQTEKQEAMIQDLQRKLKSAEDASPDAKKAANESMIKNLTRENALIATAWYDLTSRLQSNHVVLQRRQDAPKSWLNKQRQMVNATPRR